jgi:bifunctional DNA-binding transcriptional regulator/antitoxin component of YhaV-PrlF toxin-antitoxin module
MTTKTKLYKGFQTVVPIEVREKFDVDLDDILHWDIAENSVTIKFEKKITWDDVIGCVKIDKKTDAAKLKKKIELGDYEV